MPKNLSFCAEQVRRHDRDRFLAALFAPREKREALFALYAFNLEVARAREAVREPHLALIRQQWWRDALGEIYDGAPPRQHPVLTALAPVLPRLPRPLFERLIDVRASDLDPAPFATLAELEAYGADTAGGLVELALAILGADDPASRRAGRALGTAWALIGLLRATPHLARAGRVILPLDLLRSFGLAPDRLDAARGTPPLAEAVATIARAASGHLARARAEAPLSAAARPALLLGPLADAALGQLRRARHDPWALPARLGFAPLRLAIANWRGRY